MSARQLFRAFIPYLILLAGNGLWALAAVAFRMQSDSLSTDHLNLIVSYGYAICVLLILYFFYYRKGLGRLADYGSFHPLIAILLGCAFFLIFSGGLGLFSLVFPNAFTGYRESLLNATMSGSVFMWIYSILLAPAAEEFTLRGLTMGNLEKYLPFSMVNFLQAILFAIIHANLIQVLYAFLMGLILGIIYKKCGGFKAAFLFHACFNAMNLLLFLKLF